MIYKSSDTKVAPRRSLRITPKSDSSRSLIEVKEKNGPEQKILVEIVGATNLASSKIKMCPLVIVKNWDGILLHRTQILQNECNPIWSVSSGNLFLMNAPKGRRIRAGQKHVLFEVRNAFYSTPSTLVGRTEIDVIDILESCTEERVEFELIDGKNGCSQKNEFAIKKKIALRFRFATEYDLLFMEQLRKKEIDSALEWDEANLLVRMSTINNRRSNARFISEQEETAVMYNGVLNAFSHAFANTRKNSKGLKEYRVKPGPDILHESETSYLTEDEMKTEMYKPSTNWTEAGSYSSSLGVVYLEILNCEGLPNMDTGGALGNKTDTFVCAVHEDGLAQTDVIDDCLSPMWMPWTQRAFAFSITHASSPLYLAVMDYDVGPGGHEAIGRVAINLNNFESNVVYTLKFGIYPAANILERKQLGTITVRLRKKINNEKALLFAALKKSPCMHVNMHKIKSLPAVNYACYGQYDEDKYDITLLRSYVNEILELKTQLIYCIGDALKSLVLWRGQVKIGNLYLPIHSACAFVGGLYLVDRPHLLPSFFFLGIAWVMLASMKYRSQHPSPWYRTKDFLHYVLILVNKKSPYTKTTIRAMEGEKEAFDLRSNWNNRMEVDTNKSMKIQELQEEMDGIANEAIHTAEDRISLDPLANALESLAPKLFPIQKRLRGVCHLLRNLRAITTWEENLISFWITLSCLSIGVVLFILPTAWLIKWFCKIMIWTFLGPWMGLYYDVFLREDYQPLTLKNDEERMNYAEKMLMSVLESFKKKSHVARVKGEQSVKRKAFRILRFGKYIAKVPTKNITRHYDYPLPESTAIPVLFEEGYCDTPKNFDKRKVVPGQKLKGHLIPLSDEQLREITQKSKQESLEEIVLPSENVQSGKIHPSAPRSEIGNQFKDHIDEVASHSILNEDESEKSLLIPKSNNNAVSIEGGVIDVAISEKKIFDYNTDKIGFDNAKPSVSMISDQDLKQRSSNSLVSDLEHSLSSISKEFVEEEGIEIVAWEKESDDTSSETSLNQGKSRKDNKPKDEVRDEIPEENSSRCSNGDDDMSLSTLFRSSDGVYVAFCRTKKSPQNF